MVEQPLLAEWKAIREKIAALMEIHSQGGKKANAAHKEAQALFVGFLERLKAFRVLDPACGSGNFLYLSLKALKDLEHRANLEAEALDLQRQIGIETSPANVLGIELNPYAAELARVTVWIGEIQWMLAHGYAVRRNPILAPLDHIECRDAVLQIPLNPPFTKGEDACATPSVPHFESGLAGMGGALSPNSQKGRVGGISEPDWPAVDAIVGNPPFLGDKKMRSELGEEYTEALRYLYKGRVPGGADLVTYWFEKARAHIEQGKAKYAGLVATNSIRGGASRKVLERIAETGTIFNAWSDEPWINNGAAVRVSLVCFASAHGAPCLLDGQPVSAIHADLTAGDGVGGMDLTQAKQLKENAGIAFLGIQRTGPFDISGELARNWLGQPNPHGKSNSFVVKPWYNGIDITRRNQDNWIIDFGTDMLLDEACLYEAPFAYALQHIKPTRVGKREKRTNEMWWIFQWSRPLMRAAIAELPRFIVTPEVAKYRVFKWMTPQIVPDKNLTVIARSDDATFGILHSRFHELWSLRMGTSLEDRPRYTPTTTFETFPFPAGLTPDLPSPPAPLPPAGEGSKGGVFERISAAARRLNELRENWLNPPEWVDWVRTPEEEKAGFPARPVAKPGCEAELKKRTLTNLYNARPAWLDNAHKELDSAVAAAYGWEDYTPEMADEEILRRLLALNLARAG